MKMNRTILSKTNTLITKPILNLLIFLLFISTCSKNPTESPNNNNTDSGGLSIRHEISIGEQIQNNIIVPADTITAFVTSSGLPAVEKYVTFNRITNEQSILTPIFAITDSMGVAKSIYKLVYSDELSSDTVSAFIAIGAGNDANSITAHDTVGLVYVLKAVDPLSAVEYFNFYPGENSNWAKYASEDLEVKVLVRNIAGVGVCNVPIRFRLIGNVNSPPNGVIESESETTCELNNSEGESGNNNTFGEASIIYKSDGAGIDTLIASIVDPSNDTLFLFADTISIQTIGSTLLIEDVISISSNAGISNIIISNADSIKTDTIFARALDINGALISGIPFQFSISEDVGGYSELTLSEINSSIYLSVGGLSISDSLGVAYQILTIDPNIFPTLGNLYGSLESIQLSVSIDIPSTDKSSSVDVNILNNLPESSEGSVPANSEIYLSISSLQFYPNINELLSLPDHEEEISIIVKDALGAGICDIPVTFRLEEVSPNPNIFGVISASSATTCDTSNGSNISGVAQLKYNNSIEGSDLLFVEITDLEDESIILFSDSLLINTVGSTSLVEIVTEISANANQSHLSVFSPNSIITDTIYSRALDANGSLVSEIPFQFQLSEYLNGAVYLYSSAAISDSSGVAYSIINVHSSIFSSMNNTENSESLLLNVTITIPSTELSRTIDIEIFNDLPFWYPSSAELTLTSSSYILPCESCEDSTPAIITATVLDSLNNPPPSGTVIEFSSLQKDTTGTSGEGEGFQWVPIGNIAPADTLNPGGIATVNFYMQNDKGIAYIIGSIDPFNVSDTIQIIIESKDANHIEILPPALDEIVVQGGGGVEYSEVFVQITDDAGNIIYDKPYLVQFELVGAPSGATLENGVDNISKIANSGESSVTIVSGTAPGAVNLRVELFNVDDDVDDSENLIAFAVTTPLTIVTGAPEYGEINFSVIDMAPVIGGGLYEYPLSVYLEDVHSNPVADSTSVYFKIRENADPWDPFTDYNFNDRVTWFNGVGTVMDSVVYTCIDNVTQPFNCAQGTDPLTDPEKWVPSAHPAEIVGHGETGMASPFDGNSYPGVAFSKMLFGSNSIAAEVIIFVQTYSSSGTEFIIDSRTNHSGNGIVFPCYECSISLTVLPTQWDFSLPPFDVNADTDFQDVMVSATVTDYFQFPVFNAEILLDAPQADFIFVCGGEDTDLDGVTGYCIKATDDTDVLSSVDTCWECADYNPEYIWIIEDTDENDIDNDYGILSEFNCANTPPTSPPIGIENCWYDLGIGDGTGFCGNCYTNNEVITPDDIPNYARTSSTGVGLWMIRYSEGVNIEDGTDPVTYQTFNTTITVYLITPSTNSPSATATLTISKSEED